MKIKVSRGVLGWGNRKAGLEPYGPGGRWFKRGDVTKSEDVGDLLGDHLSREGWFEGDRLVIIGFDRFTKDEDVDAFIARLHYREGTYAGDA